jgi:hypothetical protein
MTRTRRLTFLYCAARAGFGLALLGPPSWAAESWIGRDAARRPVGVAMRGLAIRDLAVALGAIDALRRDGAVAPWLVAAAACDVADIAISLAAGDSLPKRARWGTPVLAGASAVVGAGLAVGETSDTR